MSDTTGLKFTELLCSKKDVIRLLSILEEEDPTEKFFFLEVEQLGSSSFKVRVFTKDLDKTIENLTQRIEVTKRFLTRMRPN